MQRPPDGPLQGRVNRCLGRLNFKAGFKSSQSLTYQVLRDPEATGSSEWKVVSVSIRARVVPLPQVTFLPRSAVAPLGAIVHPDLRVRVCGVSCRAEADGHCHTGAGSLRRIRPRPRRRALGDSSGAALRPAASLWRYMAGMPRSQELTLAASLRIGNCGGVSNAICLCRSISVAVSCVAHDLHSHVHANGAAPAQATPRCVSLIPNHKPSHLAAPVVHHRRGGRCLPAG